MDNIDNLDNIDNMDKKTVFQINKLRTTLASYLNSLHTLLEQREIIINTNINKNKISGTTELDTSDNKLNIVIDEKTSYINRKMLLDTEIIKLKTNIVKCKNDYANITNMLKHLPEELKINLYDEETIYSDEITNIDNLLLELEQLYISNIDNANKEKIIIYTSIETLKAQLQFVNNNIDTLQTNAHKSRKHVLQDLYKRTHEKKQLHLNIHDIKTNIESNNNIYLQKINIINTIKNNLIQLQKLIINKYYTYIDKDNNKIGDYNIQNIDDDDDDDEDKDDDAIQIECDCIIKFLNIYDIDICDGVCDGVCDGDSNSEIIKVLLDTSTDEKILNVFDLHNIKSAEYFKKIINNIDNILEKNRASRDTITHNNNNVNIYNTHCLNNISNNILTKNSNNISGKIHSYKDLYKIEKNKRSILQTKYDTLSDLYNNYETLVINKIKNTYDLNIIEFNNSKVCALSRNTCMATRFNNDFDNKKTTLEAQLNIIQNNLYNYNNNLIENTKQLHDINIYLNIIDEDKININIIDNKINTINNIIEQITNDIKQIKINQINKINSI